MRRPRGGMGEAKQKEGPVEVGSNHRADIIHPNQGKQMKKIREKVKQWLEESEREKLIQRLPHHLRPKDN